MSLQKEPIVQESVYKPAACLTLNQSVVEYVLEVHMGIKTFKIGVPSCEYTLVKCCFVASSFSSAVTVCQTFFMIQSRGHVVQDPKPKGI